MIQILKKCAQFSKYSYEIFYQLFCSSNYLTLIYDESYKLIDVLSYDLYDNQILLSKYESMSNFGWTVDYIIPKSFLNNCETEHINCGLFYDKKNIYHKLKKFIESPKNMRCVRWNLPFQKWNSIFEIDRDFCMKKLTEIDKSFLKKIKKIRGVNKNEIVI